MAKENNVINLDLTNNLSSIVETQHFGFITRTSDTLTIVTNERDDEAITGAAASEFATEAQVHPERYEYLASHVARIATRYRIANPFIMDFGCGPAILTNAIAKAVPTARIMGIDLSDDMLAIAKTNVLAAGTVSVSLEHYNVKHVFNNTGTLADIVVSRNMLHRLDSLEEGLMAMARATKERGGIVFNSSFRNLSDLVHAGQARWTADFRERNGFPALQTAWALAYMNAPTLEQYKKSALSVAKRISAQECIVTPGELNEVNIFIRR